MEPIKVKLTCLELMMVRNYLTYANSKADSPQAGEEIIVLAEHLPIIERRIVAAWRRNKSKPYPYSLPLSVARILHRRWQQEVISDSLRMVLCGIDYELTARNMKPDTLKAMIV